MDRFIRLVFWEPIKKNFTPKPIDRETALGFAILFVGLPILITIISWASTIDFGLVYQFIKEHLVKEWRGISLDRDLLLLAILLVLLLKR